MTNSGTRLAALRQAMAAAGVDLVAIGPTANMRYLLNSAPHADERLCLLLVSGQTINMVVPTLNAGDVAAFTDLPQSTWPDAEGPAAALRQALAGHGPIGRLAIDGPMRADFLLPLLAAVSPRETGLVEPLLAPLRMRKSAEEVEALARAAAQADRAMQAAIDACRPGVTEAEVAWAVEQYFRLDGAETVTFTLIAAGPHGAHPHHHSSDHRLQAGESVIIDIGASLGGYQSDITRTIFLGEPPQEFLRVYQAVLLANGNGRAAVRPGVAAQDVDRAARDTIAAAGYGDYFIHRTGHGLGLEIHEPPYMMAGNLQPLEAGMAFSVEPGIYLPGRFGVRIEDIVVVTETGSRTLNNFERQLIVKK